MLTFSPAFLASSWLNVLSTALSVLGTIWFLAQFFDHFWSNDSSILAGSRVFWMVIAVSILCALIAKSPKLTRKFTIRDTDISVILRIGSVTIRDADLVIATNSTFDTTFENEFISKKSVQGKLCLREYENVSQLDEALCTSLSGISYRTLSRQYSKTKQYPIGTIAKLFHAERKSYWVALADVNEHGKPAPEYDDLFICLENLWRFIEEKGHLSDIAMPVIGSGKSGLVIQRSQIIKDIVLSFVHFTRDKKIVDSLTICIFPDDLKRHDINLDQLAKYIEYQCSFAFDAPGENSTSQEI